MKCIAIAQRGSAKDFVDLYYLLQRTRMDFADVFSLVRKKYAVQDSYAYQLKTSLVFFEDAEKEIRDIRLIRGSGVEQMGRSFWDRIKMFFQECIQ
jgi:predicted nucleotidyltransferase component of viral defense system